MSGMIQLSTNAQTVMRRFARYPLDVQTAIVNGVRRALLVAESNVQRGASLKFRRGGAGLAGRLTSFARPNGAMGVDGAIGFRKTKGFPYELSQEFGAKAKPGKALSIPLTEAARQAGSPRNYPGELVLVKTPNHAFLVPKDSRSRTLKPAYVLKKSIPARLNFRKSVLATVPRISSEIEAAAR